MPPSKFCCISERTLLAQRCGLFWLSFVVHGSFFVILTMYSRIMHERQKYTLTSRREPFGSRGAVFGVSRLFYMNLAC